MKKVDIIICTGGFETICEAIYNKKKVIMIPSENHFEQYTNCQLFSSNIPTIKTVESFKNTNEIIETISKLINESINDKLYNDIHEYYLQNDIKNILLKELEN